MSKIINIFTDGGSRGNPGLSAIGVYMTNDKGEKIAGFGKTIGIATNNIAEYTAVIEAFDYLLQHKSLLKDLSAINFYLDSRLVCMQVTRKFKMKSEHLAKLLSCLWIKEKQLQVQVHYSHIPREKNKEADRFVNQALDNQI